MLGKREVKLLGPTSSHKKTPHVGYDDLQQLFWRVLDAECTGTTLKPSKRCFSLSIVEPFYVGMLAMHATAEKLKLKKIVSCMSDLIHLMMWLRTIICCQYFCSY